ncbi:hypothetical protein Dip518_000236 [Parelusimicrobium proximum]|uniref:PPC domain-containing DNA-binding protein n=1 Tax=Parelusimicrobium proximum TaxID=3228953 RepID=UPI003D176A02
MAEEKPYLTGRTYICRLSKGKDLLEQLTDFCHDNQIKCGIVEGVGAVDNVTLGIYEQSKKKYNKIVLDDQHEMVSLTGNVSIKDNRPFVFANITVADKEGNLKGGHLMPGTKIYVAEVYIQELVGEPKVRKEDKTTKMMLWI